MTPDSPPPGRPGPLRGVLALSALVVVAGFATYSVVRFDLAIVAAYTVGAVLLALTLARSRGRPPFSAAAVAVCLLGCALVTWRVPAFTYVASGPAATLRTVVVGSAVAGAALLLLPHRRAADAALALCAGGYLAVAAAVIRLDPAPRIDVWYTVQGAADALLAGRDPYQQVWVAPPGLMTNYTYLPWTGVLLAPGRWLLGDIRWALVGATLLAALAVRALPGPGAGPPARRAATGIAAVLLMLPGTTTQVEQGWTEPLLLACLSGFALALRRGHTRTAVVLLALGCASKQHLVLLLPVLAAWPGFGPRRSVAGGLLAGALVLPWVVASPAAIVHDTVSLLVWFPPIRFSDTLYLAARHEWGWTPPFWLTGAVVAITLILVTLAARRRARDVGEVLRWCSLLLLVANLVNKQAFYNQFWLAGALLLVSWAVPAAGSSAGTLSGPAGRAPALSSPAWAQAAPGSAPISSPQHRPADPAVAPPPRPSPTPG